MAEYLPLSNTEKIDNNEKDTVLDKNESVLDLKGIDNIDKTLSNSSDSIEDIDDLNYQKKKNNLKRKIKYGYIILGVTYILFLLFYKLSLKGGDLEYIQSHLIPLGILLFISCLNYSITLWTITKTPISLKQKLVFYLIDIISIVGVLLYDNGQMFDKHGTYNFIAFSIFFVIGNVIALILYFWFKFAGKKWFTIQLICFIIIFGIIEFISLKHYINIWGNGYINKKMEDGDNLCKIKKPITWFDLLPRGTQNVWTGPQSCSRKEQFDAFFDASKDNKLVVNGCSEKKITYKILPETRLMSYEEKVNDMKINVVDKMNEKEYTYTEPVELKNIEAVYVTCGEQSKLVTRLAGRRVDPAKEEQPEDKLNLLIMYFDAVSRRQFFRNLPKTVKKLESLHNSGITHLNQFFRYGIIGFNTRRNSLGLFTGLQLNKDQRGIPIWEEYRNRGYVAGVADDLCEDWDTIYNNHTTVNLDHELLAPFCLPEYHERNGLAYGNFKGPFSLRRRCITGQYVHNYALSYTKEFIDLYDGTNPWVFRSSYIEGHESTSEVLGLMDDDLETFFGSLSDEMLNRTAIVIMSDHGLHMGFSFAFSEQGATEHKLPMFTTLIPERFLNKYPEIKKNLEENEQKLITAYDIYATFRDLLDFDISREPREKAGGTGIDLSEAKLNGKEISIRKRNDLNEENRKFNNITNPMFLNDNNEYFKREAETETSNGTIIWGKSLLRKIPNRSCEEVLIYPEHCVCH
ncbi:DUF229-domain-containing protein [Piromyces finnis]|uniref:DUF229-domain-containing protein n=1 Tax=Piromyces finnis TaxID=1754191 RepID=A0A1Y1VJN8_9FUNG|nr:DUF229-domain-containing protein [Piromyces finnis]|eukprot:ORX57272.1 DUF229-domain-containing protein [Piromyces finnis]